MSTNGDECGGFTVHEQSDMQRFELRRDDEVVGYARFREHGDAVVVPHVETLREHRGQGYAGRLMDGIVDHLRSTGRTIAPHCSFAASYIREHPEHDDLLQPL